MSIKAGIKPFVPPIIWESLSKKIGKPAAPIIADPRGLREIASDETLAISYHRVAHPEGHYFVPKYADHRPASKSILKGGLYEPQTHALVSKVLGHRPGDMVHAGTFFGDMLPTFSRSCPKVVYAFEPVFENYSLAKLCVDANNLENVVLFNAGLGSSVSTGRIDTGNAGETHKGGSSTFGDHGQITALMAIDCLGLKDVSIIQLDVEGFELEALRGAQKTIERCMPIIMVEDNDRNCDPFLTSLGYRFVGSIPGLFIWCTEEHFSDVENML